MSAFIGAGVSYRRRYRSALLGSASENRPAVLEVVPGHFFGAPSDLDALAAEYPVVFHEVALSVGTTRGKADVMAKALLDRVRDLVARAAPVLVSDHLAMTRSPEGVDLGHLCPLFPSRESLALVSERVRTAQDLFGVPVALENIASPFELKGDLTEAQLFGELTRSTGCGMLLDLTNLVLDAKNFGFDASERLERYPLEAVWQVHLSGGTRVGDFWVDSHSAPVGSEELVLLTQLRRRARGLRAIVIERDQALPPLDDLLAQARSAEHVWRYGAERERPCLSI